MTRTSWTALFVACMHQSPATCCCKCHKRLMKQQQWRSELPQYGASPTRAAAMGVGSSKGADRGATLHAQTHRIPAHQEGIVPWSWGKHVGVAAAIKHVAVAQHQERHHPN